MPPVTTKSKKAIYGIKVKVKVIYLSVIWNSIIIQVFMPNMNSIS